MKLHNTLTRQTEEFKPFNDTVRIYSCGPTVYDRIHIGNLSAFIYADLLRRTLIANGYTVQHVMNITDIDDKTINRSRELYPDNDPRAALNLLTEEHIDSFMSDMLVIGNDVDSKLDFIRATDSIEGMRRLVTELFEDGYAYLTDDGIYFSIDKYRESGKKYGQLSDITPSSTANARINNDEYNKESAHDFALWKRAKLGEPSWPFELGEEDVSGRPGWHIECSVMSVQKLGQPFDIHTGGIDLIFPHHENEIAQSTALSGEVYAKLFFHNEHLLVDGKKMSKSLKNFYTLNDVTEKNLDPKAFRVLILQSHYRKQAHFSWDNLLSAQNRLRGYERMADLKWQPISSETNVNKYDEWLRSIIEHLSNDLDAAEALRILSEAQDSIESNLVNVTDVEAFQQFLTGIQDTLGIELAERNDIQDTQKELIKQREAARKNKDWKTSDDIRDKLEAMNLGIRDTNHGPIWFRI